MSYMDIQSCYLSGRFSLAFLQDGFLAGLCVCANYAAIFLYTRAEITLPQLALSDVFIRCLASLKSRPPQPPLLTCRM